VACRCLTATGFSPEPSKTCASQGFSTVADEWIYLGDRTVAALIYQRRRTSSSLHLAILFLFSNGQLSEAEWLQHSELELRMEMTYWAVPSPRRRTRSVCQLYIKIQFRCGSRTRACASRLSRRLLCNFTSRSRYLMVSAPNVSPRRNTTAVHASCWAPQYGTVGLCRDFIHQSSLDSRFFVSTCNSTNSGA